MPAKVGYLAIDTVDPGALAPFWCGLPFRWRRLLETVSF
jgi:hypothetical protein